MSFSNILTFICGLWHMIIFSLGILVEMYNKVSLASSTISGSLPSFLLCFRVIVMNKYYLFFGFLKEFSNKDRRVYTFPRRFINVHYFHKQTKESLHFVNHKLFFVKYFCSSNMNTLCKFSSVLFRFSILSPKKRKKYCQNTWHPLTE